MGGDPAGRNQRGGRAETRAEQSQARAQAVEHYIDNCLLKPGAKIGDVLVAERSDLLRFESQRGLEARQREVRLFASVHGTRQFEACRVTVGGLSFDLWAPWIAKTKQFCGLVEGFANGVVLRGAEAHIIPNATYSDDLGMAAGSKEQAIRKRGVDGQPGGQGMCLKMIDSDQWLVFYQCNRLCRCQPDDDSADQPRPARGSDPVDGVVAAVGLRHSFGDDAVQSLYVSARSDFRHHAAERGMLAHLREDHVG